MTDLAGRKFIKARWFRSGRSKSIRMIVIHSAEGAKTADALGNYFATTDRQASSHVGYGQDGSAAQYVHDEDTAYCAKNANADGWHVELCGFHYWNRAEWLAHRPMLNEAAKDCAKIAKAHHIPTVWLTADGVARGTAAGFTTHRVVSKAFPSTGHSDPGPDFPLDVFMSLVIHHMNPKDWRADGHSHPLLREGAKGREVTHLQTLLNRHGAHLRADGVFGSMTTSAVKAYQRSQHIGTDGVVGSVTWQHLHTA